LLKERAIVNSQRQPLLKTPLIFTKIMFVSKCV
jgi:hypothetical protein